MECMCAQTRPPFILSAKGGVWGNRVRTPVNSNSKGKLPSTRKKILLRGGSNPQHCTKKDSEPNILPTELSQPHMDLCNQSCSSGQPTGHCLPMYLSCMAKSFDSICTFFSQILLCVIGTIDLSIFLLLSMEIASLLHVSWFRSVSGKLTSPTVKGFTPYWKYVLCLLQHLIA